MIVIEIQKNGNTVTPLVEVIADKKAAESRFHSVLSFAATSKVDEHSCVLLADDGSFVRWESYKHSEETAE